MPKDFTGRYEAIKSLREVFHQEAAAALAPSFNQHLRNQPFVTLQQRRDFASWVNRTLRETGLALACPKTGLPAILLVNVQDMDQPGSGRFRIEARDHHGGRLATTTSKALPDFRLVPDPPRVEGLSRGR